MVVGGNPVTTFITDHTKLYDEHRVRVKCARDCIGRIVPRVTVLQVSLHLSWANKNTHEEPGVCPRESPPPAEQRGVRPPPLARSSQVDHQLFAGRASMLSVWYILCNTEDDGHIPAAH